MACTICSIRNGALKAAVESYLEKNGGCLSTQNREELKSKFPDEDIDQILDEDCSIHWNFHQAITREAEASLVATENSKTTLAADIHKDEGYALYELLNQQSATMTCLAKKINKTIEKAEDAKDLMLNPNVLQFYRETSDSIRATVRELRELNRSINGSDDGSVEGLKALAVALTINKSDKPLDTNEYD